MADYRSMYDRDYIGSWDLGTKDVTVTIAKVVAGELTSQGNRKTKKPVIYFEGKEKGFALNKTNGKIIAGLYGPDTTKWVGRAISIYATKTQFGSDTVDCIRVRPQIPQAKAARNKAAPAAGPAPEANGTEDAVAEPQE